MENFVAKLNNFELLTIVAKLSILDICGFLVTSLAYEQNLFSEFD